MDRETQEEKDVDQSKVTIASVIRLIDSIDYEHLNLDKHREVCLGINEIVTENSLDLLDEHFIDRVLEYLKILICMCDGHNKPLGFIKNVITKFPLSKIESSISQLISSRINELESELKLEWFQHHNMCAVIEKVLKAHRDTLEQTVINQMFDYCSKVIQKCHDAQLISRAFFVFSKFPLAKLESSLPSMIEPLKSKFETKELTNWCLHNNFGVVIEEVLDEHRDSLTHALIDQMFEYLTDVISKCENGMQISCAIGAFTKFPLAKLETSLPQSMRLRKDELESELNPEWHQHQNMCAVNEKVLKAHRDSLEQTVIDQMFDYCSKLLRKCPNSKLISRCFCAFSQFLLSKLESSLPSMIETLKGELKTTEQQQSKWYLHDNMSGVIYGVLDEWQESLNQAFIDQMFAYLAELIHRCANGELISISFEAFGKFPLIKLQSSLPQLIRSMEDQLECDQCTEWFPHDNVGSAIQFVLMAHSMLDQSIIEQMCEYCTKLVHSCEDGQRIEYALGVFAQFPPSELQTSLAQLICSMENKLESGQSSTEWLKHENVCIAIHDVLDLHCATLSQELINQIFAYLTKLLLLQRGENHLKEALIAFAKIPLKRIKMIMSEMIKSTAEFLKYQNASGIIEKC